MLWKYMSDEILQKNQNYNIWLIENIVAIDRFYERSKKEITKNIYISRTEYFMVYRVLSWKY